MAEKYTSSILREVKGKDGKRKAWKGVLKYKADDGKWKQVAKTFGAEVRTKTQANKALRAWHEEMEAKALQGDEAKKSVSTYIAEYIEMRRKYSVDGKRKIEASTAHDYEKTAKHLESGFSRISVGEVTPKYVRDWQTEQLREGVSVNCIRKCYRLLHLVFQHAYINEEIQSNPLDRVNPPAADDAKEPNSLTPEGMKFVTAKLEAMEPTAVVVAAYIALHAGLRCSEVCALRWSDIDFDAETISVHKAIGFTAGGCYEKNRTKTGKARVIDFDSEHMADLLKARRKLVQSERVNITTDFEDLYVCGSFGGENFGNPSAISRNWLALSREWELKGTTGERINFHALRHSYITAQLGNGANVRDVADNAGHASTQMTLNTYASSIREGKKKAAQLSGEYMRPDDDAEVLDFKTGTEG